jgi:hypothetical protein
MSVAAFTAMLTGCATGGTLVAGHKVDDHSLVRLVLLDDARETEQQCVAANGRRSSEGCMAAYMRGDGAVGVVAWLTRTMPIEEYERALPLWCESVAAVQQLPVDRCRTGIPSAAEIAPSAQPGDGARPQVSLPVGPVASGHLLTLGLGNRAGIEMSENPVMRVRVDVPTRIPDAHGWKVVAEEWCHSLAHAEWQLIRRDPCHGGSDELRVNVAPIEAPMGWVAATRPCIAGANQFCAAVTVRSR